jgi:predicted amidohydrolase YtcJ
MTLPRADLVLCGQVAITFAPDRVVTAEAIGIARGRIVAAGQRRDVVGDAAPRSRVIDAGDAAIVPGIHDFHLHLTGMARARREVDLSSAAEPGDIAAALRDAADRLPPGAWLTGGRWGEAVLRGGPALVAAAIGDRPAYLVAHDGHSAWASPAALAAAGIDAATADPAGGRIERDADGGLTGLLRERAMLPVAHRAERLEGEALADAIGETVEELLGWGITGATDAGDYDAARGVGAHADLGESFSRAWEARSRIDGRLRMMLDIPAAATQAAAARGLATGLPLAGTATLRFGWAKLYADGTLGSRTAALFAPASCGDGADLGILRLSPDELLATVTEAHAAQIGIAAHAIGDRAGAAVLDAVASAPPRAPASPPDRLEHAQLMRPADRARLAAMDVTASVQPIHVPSDRDTADACWRGRLAHAYAYRSLAVAGARLALGTDAPIESAHPWRNLHAAVRRHAAGDGRDPWTPDERLPAAAALAAMTLGPGLAVGATDEGHLAPGARADVAVLSCDLATLLAADERLAAVRSELTLVDGLEVHRS